MVDRYGHLSSTTHWAEKEALREEMEHRHKTDPWPWFEELQRWTDEHSTPEVRAMRKRFDPPPIQAHKNPR